ncbi:MAG: hypothetical protein ACHQ5A_08845 [Opitutales bacterium]
MREPILVFIAPLLVAAPVLRAQSSLPAASSEIDVAYGRYFNTPGTYTTSDGNGDNNRGSASLDGFFVSPTLTAAGSSDLQGNYINSGGTAKYSYYAEIVPINGYVGAVPSTMLIDVGASLAIASTAPTTAVADSFLDLSQGAYVVDRWHLASDSATPFSLNVNATETVQVNANFQMAFMVQAGGGTDFNSASANISGVTLAIDPSVLNAQDFQLIYSAAVTPVPEPSACCAVLGAAALGVACVRRRRNPAKLG